MITEEQRQAWNAAVAAHDADPADPGKAADRDRLKRELLDAVLRPHVEELMALQARGAVR